MGPLEAGGGFAHNVGMLRFSVSSDVWWRLPRHPDWKYEMVKGEAWLSSRPRPLHLCRSTSLEVPAVTRASNYSRLWLLIAGALAVFGEGRSRRAAGRGLIAIAIAAVVANGPAKLLVRRRRPSSRSRPTLIRTPRSTSFPSGHTAAAFAFATGACTELPVLAPVLVPLAGAVAFSRVHTGVHYPSDVAAGIGIGVGSGLLTAHMPSGITTSARSRARTRHSPPRALP